MAGRCVTTCCSLLKKNQNGPNHDGLGWLRVPPKYAFGSGKRRRAGGASTYPTWPLGQAGPSSRPHQLATLAASTDAGLLASSTRGTNPTRVRLGMAGRRCTPPTAGVVARPAPLRRLRRGRPRARGAPLCRHGSVSRELTGGGQRRCRGFGRPNTNLARPGGRGDQGELFHRFN